jgi:hypothetical protein
VHDHVVQVPAVPVEAVMITEERGLDSRTSPVRIKMLPHGGVTGGAPDVLRFTVVAASPVWKLLIAPGVNVYACSGEVPSMQTCTTAASAVEFAGFAVDAVRPGVVGPSFVLEQAATNRTAALAISARLGATIFLMLRLRDRKRLSASAGFPFR